MVSNADSHRDPVGHGDFDPDLVAYVNRYGDSDIFSFAHGHTHLDAYLDQYFHPHAASDADFHPDANV